MEPLVPASGLSLLVLRCFFIMSAVMREQLGKLIACRKSLEDSIMAMQGNVTVVRTMQRSLRELEAEIAALKKHISDRTPPPPPGEPMFEEAPPPAGPPVKANVQYYRGGPVSTDRPVIAKVYASGASGSGSAAAAAADVGTVTFDGAAGCVRGEAEPTSWHCDDCGGSFLQRSVLAYLSPDNSFKKHTDHSVDDALKAARGAGPRAWTNEFKASAGALRLVCISCCERLHSKVYVNTVTKRPTSEWTRHRKGSQNMDIHPTKAEFVMKMQDQVLKAKSKEPPKISAAEVYKQLRESSDLRLGRDWVTDLGEIASLHYGCAGCKRYPLKSNSWYKAIKCTITDIVPNMTTGGEQTGYWLCCGCLKRWTWRDGTDQRLFVVGTAESIRGGDYFYMFIGKDVTSAHEAKLNYIKTCRMLTHLNGRPCTTANILQCIAEMSEQSEAKLTRGIRELVNVRSADTKDLGHTLYCEHPSLSFAESGMHYRAIDLNLCKTSIETFTADGLGKFLDVLASCLDVDVTMPVEPAMKKARSEIMYSPAFADARTRLNRICNQVVAPAKPLSAAAAEDSDDLETV